MPIANRESRCSDQREKKAHSEICWNELVSEARHGSVAAVPESNHPSLPPKGGMTEIQYLDRTATAVQASLGSAAPDTNKSPSQYRKSSC